jgi:hypothetical protein
VKQSYYLIIRVSIERNYVEVISRRFSMERKRFYGELGGVRLVTRCVGVEKVNDGRRGSFQANGKLRKVGRGLKAVKWT